MRLFAVLFALICAAQSAHAYVFLQCANLLIATNLLQNLVNAVTTLLSPANSYGGCATYCTQQGNTYSLYQPGLAGLLGTCFCTNQSPGALYVTNGNGAGGNCFAGSYQINYLPSQQWAFSTCASGSTISGGGAAFTTTDDASCYTSCSSFRYLIMTPNAAGTYSCQCGSTLTPGTTQTCASGRQQLYQNNDPSASAIARRSRIARELARREAQKTLCPASQTACVIPGTGSFECLDTKNELEACGGCINGVFDAAPGAERPAGVDCTSIPGVAVGGVSCAYGKCKVSSCAKGFTLQGGACVAE